MCEHKENDASSVPQAELRMVFFTFPEDARWNRDRDRVEFRVQVGEYAGVVRVPRRVFQTLLTDSPTAERCVRAYYLHRTRLELIAERRSVAANWPRTAMSRSLSAISANGTPSPYPDPSRRIGRLGSAMTSRRGESTS